MRKRQKTIYLDAKWLGLILAILLFIGGLPFLSAFAFADDERPRYEDALVEEPADITGTHTDGEIESAKTGEGVDSLPTGEGIDGSQPDEGIDSFPHYEEADSSPPDEGVGGLKPDGETTDEVGGAQPDEETGEGIKGGTPGENPGDELPDVEGDGGEPDESIDEEIDEVIDGKTDDPDGGGRLTAPPMASPSLQIDATIDLSESKNIDLKSTLGYEITGTSGHTYSDRKPNLNDGPLAGPSYAADTNGGLNFHANASGKTFRIIQSGVRGAPATKNGTLVVPFIHIMPGVTNVTLILEAIDLSENISTKINGSILVDTTSTATLLLSEDAENPDITSSYVRGSIYVAPGATLIIDSASSQGVGDPSGRLTVTPFYSDHAAIGGSITSGVNAGSIIINGGTVFVTQNIADTKGVATGAAIGGAGQSGSTNVAGSGTVTINGGVVTAATNGYGAAIGGGGASKGAAGNTGYKAGAGTVTINGGVVNATSSNRGAAIGGGGVYAFNSTAGAGNVTITDGVVNAVNTGYGAAIGGGAVLDADNASAGTSSYNGGCTISITGGIVTATGNKGAGVGSGQVGFQGNINNISRSIKIGEYANLKAYSSGVDTISPYTATARPAIDVSAIPSDGKYFVNARLNQVIAGNIAAKLEIRTLGGNVIDTLSLPANYRCFAYSTSVSRTDMVYVFNAATSALLGSVKHQDADGSFEIFSINTLNGYSAHGNANEALLPVIFSTDIPTPQRYYIYQGTPETGILINFRNLLADAVALCVKDNTLYTIVATEDDGNMTAGADTAINIPANKLVSLTSRGQSAGGAWTITMRGTARHFDVQGTLTLEEIIIDGFGTGGGVYVRTGGSLTLQNGAVIQNCKSAGDGGGVYTTNYANLHIAAGAAFSGNSASAWFDLGLSQADYETMFPTILSPYGQYYSAPANHAPSNHPVNNYDVNVLQSTVTVYYVDDGGAGLTAPSPISGTSKAYRIPTGFPFELDGIDGRIIPAIDGYEFVDWAIGEPAATEGNTNVALPSVNADIDIYLIYEEIVTTTVTVSQIVDGAFANMSKPFLFTVYFFSDEFCTEPLPDDTIFPYEGGVAYGFAATKPADGELSLDADGKDTFSLTHGQQITIKDIPVGVFVQIVGENGPDYSYKTSFKDSDDADSTNGHDTGARILGSQPRAFDFVNIMKTIVPAGVKDRAPEPTELLLIVALCLSITISFLFSHYSRSVRKK